MEKHSKTSTKPNSIGHFYVTCGNKSIDGKAFNGVVTAAILAYLVIEGDQPTEVLAGLFFRVINDQKKLLASNLRNLKKNQLTRFSADNCLENSNGRVSINNFQTDYQLLLASCKNLDFDAIVQFSNGEFLQGLSEKVETKRVEDWITQKEERRISAIWTAYLHGIYLQNLEAHEIENAYKLTDCIPDVNDIKFIFLFDLLDKNHLDLGLKQVMRKAIEVEKDSFVDEKDLSDWVKERRNHFVNNNTWEEPLKLWGDLTQIQNPLEPIIKESPNTLKQNPSEPLSVNSGKFQNTYSKWLLGFGLTAFTLLMLSFLLWPISSYLDNRGVSFVNKKEFSQAISYLEPAQTLNQLRLFKSPTPTIPYNLGNAYDGIGDLDKAADYYKKATKYDSSFYPAYNNLARLLVIEEDTPELAFIFFNRAYNLVEEQLALSNSTDIGLETAKLFILKNRAWASYRLGNFEPARRDIDQALGINSKAAPLHCLNALLIENTGKNALIHWQNCVAFDINDGAVESTWQNMAQERLMTQ